MKIFCKLLTLYFLGYEPQEHTWHHRRLQKGFLETNRLAEITCYSIGTPSEGEYCGPGVRPAPRIKRDGDFKDLVTQSTVFADKSPLIKDIIEDGDTTLLLAMPRRWGKTVNIDMLRRFLEIPVGYHGEIINREKSDNYQIFREACVLQPDGSRALLKISQSRIFIQDPENIFDRKEVEALALQGTYPVIYIDLKNCKGGDFCSIERLVRAELSESFSQHAYLKDSLKLNMRQRQLIEQYLTEDGSTPLTRGLKVLSRALHDHYDGKKVWILVDEYDAVANIAYRKFDASELDATIELFAGIYETAFKGNAYLEKGVLTGVQYIAQSGMLSGLNNLGKYDFTSAKYAQYYGLDQGEVDCFFAHFQVPPALKSKAERWYNGYRVREYCPENPEVHLKGMINKYNIWSIVSYLKDGDFCNFKSYWEQSGNIDFLNKLFTKPEVRESVEKLVNGLSIYFVRKDDFSADDFQQFKQMIGGNKVVTRDGLEVLLSYLFIGGYLTIDGKHVHHYRLPNMEITHEMGKRLLSYYQTICTVDPLKIQGLTNVLQNIMDMRAADLMHLQTSLENFYEQFKAIIETIKLVDDKNNEGVFANEDIAHSILNYIALQTQHTTLGSELYAMKLHANERGRADLKITNGNVGVITEIKCARTSERGNGHMKNALVQAMCYRNLLETPHNLFVAVNVERSARAPQDRTIELLCVSDMFGEQDVFGINASGNADTFDVDSNILNGV